MAAWSTTNGGGYNAGFHMSVLWGKTDMHILKGCGL